MGDGQWRKSDRRTYVVWMKSSKATREQREQNNTCSKKMRRKRHGGMLEYYYNRQGRWRTIINWWRNEEGEEGGVFGEREKANPLISGPLFSPFSVLLSVVL